MALRDAIGALPPDAIARLAEKIAAFVADEVMCPEHGFHGLSEPITKRVAELIREAAVLPQEAGAPPDEMAAFDRAEFAELLREVVALREWKAAHEAAAFGSRAPSEAAPRDVCWGLEEFDAVLAEWRRHGHSDAWLYLQLTRQLGGAASRPEGDGT